MNGLLHRFAQREGGRRPLHLASCWCWRDAAEDVALVVGRRERLPWWWVLFGARHGH